MTNVPDSIVNQRILSHLVERQVIHCASSMVSALSAVVGEDMQSDYFDHDDIYNLNRNVDWRSAVMDHSDYLSEKDGVILLALGEGCEEDETEEFTSWEEAADELGIAIEDAEREVFEHWIVTSWFAKRLEEKGETVGELFDFCIWGRCTTGQAISMDPVISEIASDMKLLEGQR